MSVNAEYNYNKVLEQIRNEYRNIKNSDEYKHASRRTKEKIDNIFKELHADYLNRERALSETYRAIEEQDLAQERVEEGRKARKEMNPVSRYLGDFAKSAGEHTVNDILKLTALGQQTLGYKDAAQRTAQLSQDISENMEDAFGRKAEWSTKENEWRPDSLESAIDAGLSTAIDVGTLIYSPLNAGANMIAGKAAALGGQKVAEALGNGIVGKLAGGAVNAIPTSVAMSLPELYGDQFDFDEYGNVVLPKSVLPTYLLSIPHGMVEHLGIDPRKPFTQTIRKSIWKALKDYANPINIAKRAGGEGLEEGLQDAMSMFNKRASDATGTDKSIMQVMGEWMADVEEKYPQLLQSVFLGGIGGALMFEDAGNIKSNKELRAQKQNVQRQINDILAITNNLEITNSDADRNQLINDIDRALEGYDVRIADNSVSMAARQQAAKDKQNDQEQQQLVKLKQEQDKAADMLNNYVYNMDAQNRADNSNKSRFLNLPFADNNDYDYNTIYDNLVGEALAQQLRDNTEKNKGNQEKYLQEWNTMPEEQQGQYKDANEYIAERMATDEETNDIESRRTEFAQEYANLSPEDRAKYKDSADYVERRVNQETQKQRNKSNIGRGSRMLSAITSQRNKQERINKQQNRIKGYKADVANIREHRRKQIAEQETRKQQIIEQLRKQREALKEWQIDQRLKSEQDDFENEKRLAALREQREKTIKEQEEALNEFIENDKTEAQINEIQAKLRQFEQRQDVKSLDDAINLLSKFQFGLADKKSDYKMDSRNTSTLLTYDNNVKDSRENMSFAERTEEAKQKIKELKTALNNIEDKDSDYFKEVAAADYMINTLQNELNKDLSDSEIHEIIEAIDDLYNRFFYLGEKEQQEQPQQQSNEYEEYADEIAQHEAEEEQPKRKPMKIDFNPSIGNKTERGIDGKSNTNTGRMGFADRSTDNTGIANSRQNVNDIQLGEKFYENRPEQIEVAEEETKPVADIADNNVKAMLDRLQNGEIEAINTKDKEGRNISFKYNKENDGFVGYEKDNGLIATTRQGLEKKINNGEFTVISEESKKAETTDNRIFTDDEFQKRMARLRSAANRIGVNPFADPQIVEDALYCSCYFIESGVRKFADYCKKMVEALGENAKAFKDYLAGFYMMAKKDPRLKALNIDKKEFSTEDEVDSFDIDSLFGKEQPKQNIEQPKRKESQYELEKRFSAYAIDYGQTITQYDNFVERKLDEVKNRSYEEWLDYKHNNTGKSDSSYSRAKLYYNNVIKPFEQTRQEEQQQQTKQTETSEAIIKDENNVDFNDAVNKLSEYVGELLTAKHDNTWLVNLLYGRKVLKDENRLRKLAQEIFEGALCKYIRDNKPSLQQVLAIYQNQPTLNDRTVSQKEFQAYSTPVVLAKALTDILGIKANDTVFEPTAGNGLLLSSVNPSANFILNEIQKDRLDILKAVFGDVVTNKDALEMDMPKSDFVITNPPFGQNAEHTSEEIEMPALKSNRIGQITKFKLTDQAHIIAMKALKAMKTNGKAVIIYGAPNGIFGKDGDNARKGGSFRFEMMLFNYFNVVGAFEIEKGLYSKQGTGYPVACIVVDGKKSINHDLYNSNKYEVKRLKNWQEVFDECENIKKRIAEEKDVLGNDKSLLGVGELKKARELVKESEKKEQNDNTTQQRTEKQPTSVTREVKQQAKENAKKEIEKNPEKLNEQLAEGVKEAEAKPVNKTESNTDKIAGDGKLQTRYEPVATNRSINALVPTNLAKAINTALKQIKSVYGDLVKFIEKMTGNNRAGEVFSAEQIDALSLYADKLLNGNAMICSDQTGLGKGRVAAGAIQMSRYAGHIPFFCTEKDTLFSDLYRDMKDTDAGNLRPFFINEKGEMTYTDENGNTAVAYKKIGKTERERVIKNLREGDFSDFVGDNAKYDYIVGTYSQFQNDYKTTEAREIAINNLINNNKVDLILDEVHNVAAKVERDRNGRISVGGKKKKVNGKEVEKNKGFKRFMVFTQNANSIMFLSATWAKTMDNMGIYSRAIGMTVDNIERQLAQGGNGMMELLVMRMAIAGKYIRREQSFEGVKYTNEIITKDEKDVAEETKQSDQYNKIILSAIEVSQRISKLIKDPEFIGEYIKKKYGEIHSFDTGEDDKELDSGDVSPFSQVHNFVNYLLLSLKADRVAEEAIKQIKAGLKPVIALEKTAGRQTDNFVVLNGLSAGDSTRTMNMADVFKGIMIGQLNNIPVKTVTGEKGLKVDVPFEDLPADIKDSFNAIMSNVDNTNLNELTGCPIDRIRYLVNKAGYNIDEVTGRTQLLNHTSDNEATLEKRKRDDKQTITDFNNGKIDCVILNESGSTGISLHAKDTFKDQKQRIMLIAQPFGDINTMMQMLGRIHRVGQVKLPIYKYVMTSLLQELRVANSLQDKLKSLNANTSSNKEGQQKFTDVDINNDYGREAIGKWLSENIDIAIKLGVAINLGNEIQITSRDPKKVTGRMAIMPQSVQIDFWQYVLAETESIMNEAKARGEDTLSIPSYDDADAFVKSSSLIKGKTIADNYYLKTVDMAVTGNPATIANGEARAKKGETIADNKEAVDKLKEQTEEFYNYTDERLKNSELNVLSIKKKIKNTTESLFKLLNTLKPGMALKSMGGDIGIVVDVKVRPTKDSKTSNPLIGSKIVITMASPTKSGTTVITGAKYFENNWQEVSPNDVYDYRIFTEDWDYQFKENSNRRIEAQVITGNLFNAIEHAENNGLKVAQVQFRTKDGGHKMQFVYLRKDRGDIVLSTAKTLDKVTDKDFDESSIYRANVNGVTAEIHCWRSGNATINLRGAFKRNSVLSELMKKSEEYLGKDSWSNNEVTIKDDVINNVNKFVKDAKEIGISFKGVVSEEEMQRRSEEFKKNLPQEFEEDDVHFSISQSKVSKAIGTDKLNAIAKKIGNALKQKLGLGLVVCKDSAELGNKLREAGAEIKTIPQGAEGCVFNGNVYLVADNIQDGTRVYTVLAHEIAGHVGAEKIYPHFKALMKELLKLENSDEKIKAIFDDVRKNYNIKDDDIRIAAEVFAKVMEQVYENENSFTGKIKNLVNFFIKKVKDFFRNLFNMNIPMSAREVYAIANNIMKVTTVKSIMKGEVVRDKKYDASEVFKDEPVFRLAEGYSPKKTKKVYKLMRLKDDGKLYPLFIDASVGIEVGKWYKADSPDFAFLKKLPAGYHLCNLESGESIKSQVKRPSKKEIQEATSNNLRWMNIIDKSGEKSASKFEKKFGDTRAYYNVGINGSGAVAEFALRPGWHAGSLTTMEQIGLGPNKDIRDDSFVWAECEVPADVDYQQEAMSNPEKDIPTHIPEDGYYIKATNPTANDEMQWFIAGALKVNRILSDDEADNIVNEHNNKYGTSLPLDHRRANGRRFYTDTMRVEEDRNNKQPQFSIPSDIYEFNAYLERENKNKDKGNAVQLSDMETFDKGVAEGKRLAEVERKEQQEKVKTAARLAKLAKNRQKGLDYLAQQERVNKAIEEARKPKKTTLAQKVEAVENWLALKFANKRQRLVEFQDTIEKALGHKLADYMNPHRQLDTIDGRIQYRTEAFNNKYFKPLYDYLVKNGITYEDFNKFTYAMHADERDKYIREINPTFRDNNKRGSGWDNAKMGGTEQQILDSLYQKYGQDKLMNAGKMFWNMNRAVIDLQEQYGLIDKKTADNIRARYKYYTPLKHIADDEVTTKVVERALGRTSTAQDNLMFATAAIDTTIRWGEKNNAKLAMLNLANVYKTPMVEINRQKLEQYFNPETGEVEIRLDRSRPDNTITARANGVNYNITFKDEELYKAFTSEQRTSEAWNAIVKTSRVFTNMMGFVSTMANPDFGIANFVRDQSQSGLENIVYRGSKFASNAFHYALPAIKTYIDYRRGIDNEDTRLYREFLENGGLTGYADMLRLDKRATNLDKSISEDIEANKGVLGKLKKIAKNPSDVIHGIFGLFEAFNDSLESATRFGVYREARKTGTALEAAELAKNITINFNRHGSLWSSDMNALYLFSNANIQGTRKAWQLLKYAARDNKGRSIIGSLVAAGFISEILGHMFAGFDPDDEVSYYDKLEEWKKDGNLVIFTGGKKYVSMPLSPVVAFPYMIGRNTAAYMTGKKNMSTAITDIFSNFITTLNPLGEDSKSLGSLVPTPMRPLVDLWTNKKWNAAKIRPEQTTNGMKKPEHQLYFDNKTSKVFVDLAKWLSDVTGGDEYTGGKIDWSPADMQYLAENYSGGLGKSLYRGYKLATSQAEGLDDIPLLRRFRGETNEYSTSKEYKDNQQIADRYSRVKSDRNFDYLNKNKSYIRISNIIKVADKQIDRIRERKNLSEAEKELAVTKIQKNANTAIRKLQ